MSTPDTGATGRGGAAAPSRDRILIDLGQELRAMRNELGEATGKFDVVVRDVSEIIGPDVATLRREVAAIRGELDALLEEPGDAEEEPALHWPDLSAEEAEEAWKNLATWVHTTLGYWFGITRGQLPDCWPLHRPALLQLWALRLLYLSAHEGRAASPLGMVEWNTRWLDAVLVKVKDAVPETLCRVVAGKPGEHNTPKHHVPQEPAPMPAATTRTSAAPDSLTAAQQKLDQIRAARGATPAARYSVPQFAGGAQPGTAAGSGEAPPVWTGTSAEDEVTGPDYWGGYLAQAREADLKWRRERDKARAAEEASTVASGT